MQLAMTLLTTAPWCWTETSLVNVLKSLSDSRWLTKNNLNKILLIWELYHGDGNMKNVFL